MKDYQLGEMELRFAELIWEHAPVPSGELVKRCGEEFSWKKSTTYTMLKRLCGKGLFENREGAVYALLSREEWVSAQSDAFVRETFGGSLPRFLAAFTRGKRLSPNEVAEIQKMIDEDQEG